jgi:hypothetical protein
MKQALILNALVLIVVLEADLGRHRKINWFRIARPLVAAAIVVPIFIKAVPSQGTGLALVLVLAVVGIVLGVVATALMRVYRSPKTGKPASAAGAGYALLWVLVIAARTAFSVGSVHWFGPQLDHWMSQHAVTSAAITDALLFMALGMLLTRTVGLAVRAKRLPLAERTFGETSVAETNHGGTGSPNVHQPMANR